jgi:pyruvate dehydrogenase E1 component alpha subunit
MADMIPLTVGAALAYKQRGEDRVAVTSFGDGATSRGDFHEGLNMDTTPISKQTKVTDLYRKAAGYGIPSVEVDGNDVFAVYSAVKRAVDSARAGGGPQFVECKTYRMAGHAAHDKYESYMPMELLAEWSDKDPLKRLEQSLRDERSVDENTMEGIRDRVKEEVRVAVEAAEADDYAPASEAHEGVFAEEGWDA